MLLGSSNADNYCVIGFWGWVFDLAIPDSVARRLASRKKLCKELFIDRSCMRLERPSTANFVFYGGKRLVLGDSLLLEGLEDKDVFAYTMNKYAMDKIPYTLLLPYDAHLNAKEQVKLPSTPAVLKQPLGCCGEGVFFVYSTEDVLKKVAEDYERATKEKGFLEEIMRSKQRIPMWILQSEIRSLPILGNRKFHLRTYVLIREHPTVGPVALMYTKNHEVRIAAEAMDGASGFQQELSRNRLQHITNGAGGSNTIRMILDDISEIRHLRGKLEDFVSRLFGIDLKDEFMQRYISSFSDSKDPIVERFVVCGLDVMVDEAENLFVLEVNRNPGAAPEYSLAGMDNFKRHLVQFAGDLYQQVRLEYPETAHGFVRLPTS